LSRRFYGSGYLMPDCFILKTIQKILILLFLQLFCFQHNATAQDSIPVGKTLKQYFKPDPMKATMMAVAFPGLGQVYNRKYWKIPLVYAGFGGLIYSAGFNSKNFTSYMIAYQDFTDKVPETKSYQELPWLKDIDPTTYDPVLHPTTYSASTASYYKDQLLRGIDYYKRYRDLSYIGIGAWYLFSILDANVDASLFNYDISKNLDIALFPVQLSLPGGFMGAGVNMSLKVTF
jgi:hypothetical protein